MTRITIKSATGSNLVQFMTELLANPKYKGTASTITVTGANGDLLVMKGSFEYPTKTTVTGTVSSSVFIDNPGNSVYALAGELKIDAAKFLDKVLNGTPAQVIDLFGSIKFNGAAGDDIGFGALKADVLTGGDGDDTLTAFGGNDIVDGGAGGDKMSGGGGTDLLTYVHSSGAVNVSLKGSASGGDAQGDSLDGFENLTGSRFGDTLKGNNVANILAGGNGNDSLNGGAGGDKLIGGFGIDVADYTGSAAGVTVNLRTGATSGGDAQGDTLVSIENLIGSANADTLSGTLAVNRIDGAGGNDTLFGDSGNDTLLGGSEDDTLDGGAGKDTLDGGSGADRLIGGASNDTLTGGDGGDTFVLSVIPTSTDTITDYVVGADHLEISAAEFGGDLDPATGLTAAQFEMNGSGNATAPTTRFILNTTNGELHYDVNGVNGEATSNHVIAVIHGDLTLFSLSDLVIV